MVTARHDFPPADLPASLGNALNRFRRAVTGDARAAAAFVGGSLATGTRDEHSDLDLYVIADDSNYDDLFLDRHSFLEAMGEVVLSEDFDGFGFDMVIFMLASGVEGELGLARSSNFSHIHHGEFVTLIDRQGLLADVSFQIKGPTPRQRRESIRRTIAWFWRQLSLFATASERGRAWTARGYLEQARNEALDLVWLIHAPVAWPGGLEKLELCAHSVEVTSHAAPIAELDMSDPIGAAHLLAESMATHGRKACDELDLVYPTRLEDTVLARLDDLGLSG